MCSPSAILARVKTIDRNLDVTRRVDDLVAGFSTYLDVFKRENPFTADQLRKHAKTSQLRRQCGTVADAIANPGFLKALHLTLESWGMNSRGARLAKPETLSLALCRRLPDIAALEGKRLDGLGAEARVLTDRLWKLIDTLGITEIRSPSNGWV